MANNKIKLATFGSPNVKWLEKLRRVYNTLGGGAVLTLVGAWDLTEAQNVRVLAIYASIGILIQMLTSLTTPDPLTDFEPEKG